MKINKNYPKSKNPWVRRLKSTVKSDSGGIKKYVPVLTPIN
jgi:hypothetical protein